jgi:hypothetical protein
VSPEILVQVAAAIGLSERDVRRAIFDVFSDRTTELRTLSHRLFGPSRLRSVREINRSPEPMEEYLEDLLRRDQGLKLRRKTEASSLWDAGDLLGTVRRALDLSVHHSLLRARSVELRIEAVGYGRSEANLTADVSNQRGEYLSLSGLLGATLALPLAIAGAYDWPYFLAAVPALVAPGLGFKLAYKKTCADVRRVMESLLDAAEEGPPRGGAEEGAQSRPPGQLRRLKPIPRFTLRPREEE